MSTYQKTQAITVIATAVIERYRFVGFDGKHAALSADMAGVSEMRVSAGQPVSAVTEYSMFVEAAEVIAEGAYVRPAIDGSGRAVTGSVSDHCGKALSGADATGAVFECRLGQVGGGGGSGVSLDSEGRPILEMPLGRPPVLLSLSGGTPNDGRTAGWPNQVIVIDTGSNTAHDEIMFIVNCPTVALMSQMFASPDDNSDVNLLTIRGGFKSGALFNVQVPAGVTSLHVALRGSSSYTEATGNALVPGQAVKITWAEELGINAFDIGVGDPGGPTDPNNLYGRTRQMTVRGFAS